MIHKTVVNKLARRVSGFHCSLVDLRRPFLAVSDSSSRCWKLKTRISSERSYSHSLMYLLQKSNMTSQSHSVESALAAGELFSDDRDYRFLKLPLSSVATAAAIVGSDKSKPFQVLMVDKDEVTMMISSDDYLANQQTLGEHELGEFTYRLITFDVVLQPTLVGFMAKITEALAAAKISVMPFAAYSRDHIFISKENFSKAMEVLNNLKKA